MKRLGFIFSFVLLLCCVFESDAQMTDRTAVWKRHRKYTNIGYEIQTLNLNGYGLKSDYGVVLGDGVTFYLHKKPIANLMKFGLDWTYLEMALTGYGTTPGGSWKEDYMAKLGDLKMDIGMGLGPSFTINPVDYLKIGVYFHVTPTYSLCFDGSALGGGYATFFNAGAHISYKVISIGYEYRWCGTSDYKTLYGETASPISRLDSAVSNRFYIAFRSGGKQWK